MVIQEDIFTDADGSWPVKRIYGWREDGKPWCNCKTPLGEWPESGWQVFAVIYFKEFRHRVTFLRGCADDPTIYHVGDRQFIGTLMDDDEYEWLSKDCTLHALAVAKKLDAEMEYALR